VLIWSVFVRNFRVVTLAAIKSIIYNLDEVQAWNNMILSFDQTFGKFFGTSTISKLILGQVVVYLGHKFTNFPKNWMGLGLCIIAFFLRF
jgi:hypothetical protein